MSSPIEFKGFKGAIAKFSPKLLPEQSCVDSTNQRPGFGDLRPWKGLSGSLATVASSQKTIYRMGQDVVSTANYWLVWSTVVHAILDFAADDTTERTCFTGSGGPKWTDNIKALTGGPPYPQATRDLGVPTPTTAITAAINVDGTGTAEPRSYVYTWINELGWESAPSPVSNTLQVKPGGTVDLTGFDAPPAGNWNVVTTRVYKVVVGSSGESDYYFLREWAYSSPPANPRDDSRGVGSDILVTDGWRIAPADGKCLTKCWNGVAAMISGKAVAFCEPFFIYAWPLKYEIAFPDAPVGLGVYGQTLVVLTAGDAFLVSGSSPADMDDEPTLTNRPCSSVQSIVSFNEPSDAGKRGVVWASEQGLCWIGDGGFRNLTEGIMTREQWQALVPSTMIASKYDGLYVCFYNDGAKKGFVIDPKSPSGMHYLTTGYDGMFRDPLTDRLFALDGTAVKLWNNGSNLTVTAKSKVFSLPFPINIGAVEVIAETYPVTVKIWGNGVLRYNQSLGDGVIGRPPGGWEADELQIEASSAETTIAVRIAQNPIDLRSA